MDRQTDKQIADKINSLDSLPQGYAPDLDSKWELLQLADKKKKSAVILLLTNRWFALAACLLLAFTAGIIWLVQPVIKSTTPKPVAEKIIHPTVKSAPHKNETVIETSKKKSKDLKSAKPKNKIIIEPNIELVQLKNSATTTNDTANNNQLVNQEVLAIQPPVKAKKQRYVQMDFEDSIVQPGEKNVSAQAVRFRFSIGNTNKNTQPFESESTLKLQRNF